ncbi:MAG: hypothetical protein EPO26_00840 [Chloroflexota bacterium]|nr:MAG: hypothetical protein EPO26_00840 [Chloroflexota bacterium]
MDIGSIRPISIEREMRESYLDYAMSVITSRALPDVRDGLKPVQRRVLYAMDELALRPTSPYKKSARIVGEVLGKYHPHGDAPVYEAMVRLAQTFSMRYPLVDGQGNFGSVDGDPPAAMRYTEARLSAVAEELLADIDKDTVAFEPNFDGSLRQPSVLPGKLPNLLVNGAVGIAVGMATNIPPHNLTEVINALVMMIDRYSGVVSGGIPFAVAWARVMRRNVAVDSLREILGAMPDDLAEGVRADAARHGQSPTEDQLIESLLGQIDDRIDVTPDELMTHITGPDFPTAALILGDEGIKQAYTTGHGRLTIRAKAHTEELKGNREAIVITELPYQVNKATLIEKIADLAREKRIDGISDMRDESDRQGMRLFIELKRDANPTAVLNQLFKLTSMQTNFSINLLALVDQQPRVLTLKQILVHYLDWRRQVLTRRTQFELDKAHARAHILEGLKVALDNLDEVIQIIRGSRETEAARQALMTRFQLSEIQATAILDMQLRRLAALERQKILDELAEVLTLVAKLEDLLAHPAKIMLLARDELVELKRKFGDQRRTRILHNVSAELTAEDLVPDQDVVVLATMRDYVRRLPGDAFRVRSTSRALPQTTSQEDDAIRHLVVANTRDTVLFFSNRGKVYGVKCHEVPEAQAKARGRPLSNVTGITPEEKITAVVAVKDFGQGGHFVLLTKGGEAKRIRMNEYQSTRAAGLIAMDLEAKDELAWVGFTPGGCHVHVLTEQGQSIRFAEEDLRSASRTSGGVRAIKLEKGDHVVDANIVEDTGEVLLITARGYGKRMGIGQFSVQGRGGGGVRAMPVSDRTGTVVVARIVKPGDEIMIASRDGIVVRASVATVPPVGRPAQGAVIIQLQPKDSVAAMARLRSDGEPPGPPEYTPFDDGGPPGPDILTDDDDDLPEDDLPDDEGEDDLDEDEGDDDDGMDDEPSPAAGGAARASGGQAGGASDTGKAGRAARPAPADQPASASAKATSSTAKVVAAKAAQQGARSAATRETAAGVIAARQMARPAVSGAAATAKAPRRGARPEASRKAATAGRTAKQDARLAPGREAATRTAASRSPRGAAPAPGRSARPSARAETAPASPRQSDQARALAPAPGRSARPSVRAESATTTAPVSPRQSGQTGASTLAATGRAANAAAVEHRPAAPQQFGWRPLLRSDEPIGPAAAPAVAGSAPASRREPSRASAPLATRKRPPSAGGTFLQAELPLVRASTEAPGGRDDARGRTRRG